MAADRIYSMPLGGRELELPCFVPSISSLKTNLRPEHYVQLLTAVHAPSFLISAYDVLMNGEELQSEMVRLARVARERGSVIFMDSGNYESYWKSDSSWTVERFHDVLAEDVFDIALSYDEQVAHGSATDAAECAIRSTLYDQEATGQSVAPILHGNASILAAAALQVVEQLCPLLIAIPERVLGSGIISRAVTVTAVRSALNELPWYAPIHLLGTGDPLSILVYAAAGADSFDGLEWCQHAVDHSSCGLLDLQHWDRVRAQTRWGEEGSMPFEQSVLLHNLDFYAWFMGELRDALASGELRGFATRRFSREAADFALASLREVGQRC